jgi:hypothetical protein
MEQNEQPEPSAAVQNLFLKNSCVYQLLDFIFKSNYSKGMSSAQKDTEKELFKEYFSNHTKIFYKNMYKQLHPYNEDLLLNQKSFIKFVIIFNETKRRIKLDQVLDNKAKSRTMLFDLLKMLYLETCVYLKKECNVKLDQEEEDILKKLGIAENSHLKGLIDDLMPEVQEKIKDPMSLAQSIYTNGMDFDKNPELHNIAKTFKKSVKNSIKNRGLNQAQLKKELSDVLAKLPTLM